MNGMNPAPPRYRITEEGMTAFDRLCARVPLIAQQRHLIETDRTGDPMTQATAWHILCSDPDEEPRQSALPGV